MEIADCWTVVLVELAHRRDRRVERPEWAVRAAPGASIAISAFRSTLVRWRIGPTPPTTHRRVASPVMPSARSWNFAVSAGSRAGAAHHLGLGLPAAGQDDQPGGDHDAGHEQAGREAPGARRRAAPPGWGRRRPGRRRRACRARRHSAG